MLISVRWLGRHIDLTGLTADQIAADLTVSTAEVEGVSAFLPHAAEVLVGLVLSRGPHPGADRLSLCQVDIGGDEPVPVVCGAPNVQAGQKVPLALPGTTIPGIGKLKKSKIRGERSMGMICSEQEIGVQAQSEGIWVLPDSLPIGTPLSEALGLDDSVIDIDNKSLTHRPDLWGHRGIARELSALYRRPLLPMDVSFPALGDGAAPAVAVDSGACSRYLALPIDGARPLPSPLWMRALLAAVGQRSLGQLVDLSNFVMLDLGQPNHVFDRSRLGPDGIVVRQAKAKEPFVALDGRALELSAEDLLISSGGEGVALAGVIGGQNTEVTEATDALLLEVATFNATTVRRASVRHGIRTDSSARFEKSLDPELPPKAAAHFARLLLELQPSVRFPAALADVRSAPAEPVSIALRPARVRDLLGAQLEDAEISDILVRLGFEVSSTEQGFSVGVPSDRATKDIGIEQDLVEEVGRLYGYGNIRERVLVAPVQPPAHDERRLIVRRIQDRLVGGARFTETIGHSFLSDDVIELFGLGDRPHCTLENPVIAGEARMRRTLVPSVLRGIEANRRSHNVVRLFEVGKAYWPENANEAHEPEERHTVALAQVAPPVGRKAGFQDNSFAQLHGVVDDLLASLERPTVAWATGEDPAWAPAGRCVQAVYADGTVVATLSRVRGEVLSGLGLTGRLASDVAVCEVSIDAIVAAPRQTLRYKPVSRFPGVKVDVAVAVDSGVTCGQIVSIISKAAGANCREVSLFDVYTGDAVGEGKKSLAYHVLLQSDDKTLSDREEQKFLQRLTSGLEAVGAQLRDG